MNLFSWKGRDALMHVYVSEHIASLYYRTAEWMFTKLGRDEVLMAWHMHKDVLVISAQWRIQGEAKYVTGGRLFPFFKNLLQTGRLQQQTEFIAMI